MCVSQILWLKMTASTNSNSYNSDKWRYKGSALREEVTQLT